jgi:hypothetical protein
MTFEKSMLLESLNIGEFMTLIGKLSVSALPRKLQNAILNCLKYNGIGYEFRGMEIEQETIPEQLPLAENPVRSLIEEEQMGNFQTDSNNYTADPSIFNQPIVQTFDSQNYFLPPGASKKYTLVLDLDETLVHFKNENGKAKFLIRPYTYTFLKNLSFHFEIIIFTAAQKEYADWILNKIDSKGAISHRLYREHCQMNRNSHLKVILSGPRETQPGPLPHNHRR